MVVQVLIRTGIDNHISFVTPNVKFPDNLFSSAQVSSCIQTE